MHTVRFVANDALPQGHDFVLIQAGGEEWVAFYREGAVGPQSIEDSWAAYRAAMVSPPPEVTLRSAS